MTTRREFLLHGLGATSLMASGLTLPRFLTRTARASVPTLDEDERILVVIQMTGGNDGLNTVVPFSDDRYHAARPTLRLDPAAVLPLNDTLALHPEMTALKRLYDDGHLGVVNNVGYPNPDRSHFRSMDIWQCACLEPESSEDGWLGRVIDREAGRSESPTALHLDDAALPLALKTRSVAVPSIRSIESFTLSARSESFEQAIAVARRAAAEDLLFVQRVAVSSCANARRLERISHDGARGASYPDYGLAGRLRQIAQLIGADFGPRIYYTSFGAFDTHARQALTHGPMLRELAESVAAFVADLESRGAADRVLIMTFSEFGRRVSENGSRGTDHGAAAPMFIVGRPVQAGLFGAAPNLSDLHEGDVPYEIDFRQVYASILDDWLGVDHEAVLGSRFDALPVVASRG